MASFVSKKLIGLVEAKKVAFGTVLSTEPLVHMYINFFRRGINSSPRPPTPKKGCG